LIIVLGALNDLPAAPVATREEVFVLIERQRIFNRGIGYIDTSLLASVYLQAGAKLWTRDRRLHKSQKNLD
jgi:predicted nucleic acid-binding protein